MATDPTRTTQLLHQRFRWVTDRSSDDRYADLTGWWRDPDLLAQLGPALVGLFPHAQPTVVIAPASRGLILGALVARFLSIGLVEARRDSTPASDSDAWWQRATPPDYRDRHVRFGFRKDLIRSHDRVLMVDDWVATGATASTVHQLVLDAGASWEGAAVIVDAAHDSRVRRALSLRGLLHERQLQ